MPPYEGDSSVQGKPGLVGKNSHGGDGVWGQADANGLTAAGRGLVGVSNTGSGVWGDTLTGRAVVGVVRSQGDAIWGETKTGRGVVGISEGEGTGVWADTKSGRAVVGIVHERGDAISGEATTGTGVVGRSSDGIGVLGQGFTDAGVVGFHGDPRLQETTIMNDSSHAGVFGASDIGSGVVAYTRNAQVPALFAFGGLRSYASLNNLAGVFDGNVQVNGDIFVPGADCAEHFDVAEGVAMDPGTVVVIDRSGALRPSESAYDRKVAGVISGAGGYKPGLILDKHESDIERQPIALVGKVFCKVDATYGPVAVGDMLTTSPTLGHAMRVADYAKAHGAVIGKALDDLDSGTGLVRVLVCLQ